MENNTGRRGNPFEIITCAHLRNLETKRDSEKRLFWKVTLVKALYERGYEKEDILNLYRFIDWIMGLPDELSVRFHEAIIKHEEDRKMPFITTAERIGMEKGILLGKEEGMQLGVEKGMEKGMLKGLYESIEDLLEVKFKGQGRLLREKIMEIEDLERLRAIKEYIKRSDSFEELTDILKNR